MKNIKTISISILLAVVLVGYIVYSRFSDGNPAPVVNNTDNQNGTTVNPQPQNENLTDGQFTGNTVDAFFGKVQVKATISGGKITDIQVLQYPNTPGYTTKLSNESMPILKTEAIAVQGAHFDVLSGATQTSQAFMASLQSALVLAGSKDTTEIKVTPPPGAKS